ncbi:protein translocase subunit SecD [Sphingomonas nostoxanthinifaciens]|uniref:protein translocase subunit SecD n=1 Tax=Sphingomonas nostoxanthinifaciens TaxID=2872652 RepID=UPI001CC1DCEB|nr:protein translocase subunit SecD [Sphingomonas nostoxanthinifaciens]UAK24600.1 protein translocase subunit SecD [Sphingomonas nostoxanthinifaciens]
MLDFPRWKVVTIWAVLLIGVLLAIPSLMPESTAGKLGLGHFPRINLGLDLSGGSHLLLEADTADLAKQNLAKMEETIRTEMRRGSPKVDIGDISTANGQLSFFVRDVAQLDAAVERARSQTQAVGVTGQRDWNVAVVDSTRIVMTPTQAGLSDSADRAMQTATEVVRKRIDELGTREPTIVREGATRILVQVPGLQDPAGLKALLGKTARLEFKLVDLTANPADIAQGHAPPGSVLVPYPGNPGGIPSIAVQRRTIISGDDLINATVDKDQNGQPAVSIKFNGAGGRRFAQVTQENTGKPFAMILDNQVISAPNINEPILGGNAIIQGSFTTDSANQLAIALRSGKLPVALKVIEERTVGPQLGADSIHAGVIASVIASVAVIVFMLVTYGRFGVYANLAVVLNIFVILAVMALLNATLTLPGIAGFVLTIGTAVDANVLINERIREERRRGRGIVQSIELGYKEASRTIFEANTVHAISGLIMLVLGSGPVKGFAVVLLIGIAISYFTAVFFTRMLAAQWLRRRRPTVLVI